MKIKTSIVIVAASLTVAVAQLKADLVLDSRSITETNSLSATYSGLDGIIGWNDTTNSALRPLDDTTQSLTASDMGPSETFTVAVSGLSDWNYPNATLAGLTAANIDGGNAGFGVVGGTQNNRLDADGEAVVVTFDLNNLTAAHQSNFRLTALGMNRWLDGDDFFNYTVFDNLGNVKYAADDQGAAALGNLDFAIATGDVLVVGWDGVAGTSDFTFDTFTVDVVPVPEPSAGLLLGVVGAMMLRRRGTFNR